MPSYLLQFFNFWQHCYCVWKKCRKLPFSHLLWNINWLPVFFPPLIGFWLILHHVLRNWSVIPFVSTRTPQKIFLSSLGYFSPGDSCQTKSSISLSDLSSEKLHSSLRKKSPYLELFRSAFFLHFPAFGQNTGKCGKNADQNNSEYLHFVCSANEWK